MIRIFFKSVVCHGLGFHNSCMSFCLQRRLPNFCLSEWGIPIWDRAELFRERRGRPALLPAVLPYSSLLLYINVEQIFKEIHF